MSPEIQNPDPQLERAIEEIRQETPEDAVVEAAAARVWTRLAGEARPHVVEHLRTCADFQSLIPDYRAGHLSDARAMLVKDHTHECVACRKALEAASGKVVEFPARPALRKPVMTRPAFRWAAAAVVAIGVGFAAWSAIQRFGMTNVRPTVQAVNGTLYRLTERGLEPLAAGAELPANAEIRTAKDSGAVVQLRDGSLVEVRERSGFSVSDGGADLTVKLARGSVIVQAAKRRTGHLYVTTADCRVAVTGTVFSVSAGMKGSRVSVVEGQVRVSQADSEKALKPGDQVTTNPNVEAVPVPEDIAWSRDREKYMALLKDLSTLRQSLTQVRQPEARRNPTLAGLPDNIAVYASIPNLASYLADVQTVFRQKLAESPVLREWWRGRGAVTEAIMEKVRAASDYLGEEILVVAPADAAGRLQSPVFLARSRRPGLAAFLRQQGVPLETVAGVEGLPQNPGKALYMVDRPDMVALSIQPEALRQVFQGRTLGVQDTPEGMPRKGGFYATELGQRVIEAYRGGVGLLVCADLERAAGPAHLPGGQGLRYFLAEQKQVPGKTEMRAVLGFSGTQPGIAAWLAPPAPVGALDYISPEATVASAFVMQAPGKVLEDVLGKGLGPIPPASETGFDLKEVSGALGGEFAFAIDGPVLPTPAWKLVVEVYDPNRLRAALQKMVETVNATGKAAGKPALRTSQETVNGRTYYMIASADENPLTQAHYLFDGGYLVLAANRTLLDRALQYRATGYTLTKSPQFAALVPRDRYANFSGMLYYNVAGTVSQYGGLLSSFMNDQQKKMMHDLSTSKPTLVTAYGEPDRIALAGSGSLFDISLVNLVTGNVFGGGLPFGGGKRPARQ